MDEIKPLILLVVSSLLIRQTLVFANQGWAKSYSQTNIFLTFTNNHLCNNKNNFRKYSSILGMIGALSIVRFRHPVKSALELIIYFDLITLGIATSVRTKWAIQLVVMHNFNNIICKTYWLFIQKEEVSLFTTYLLMKV